jgi:diguanylate cyclase (GGDEF)-like protein
MSSLPRVPTLERKPSQLGATSPVESDFSSQLSKLNNWTADIWRGSDRNRAMRRYMEHLSQFCGPLVMQLRMDSPESRQSDTTTLAVALSDNALLKDNGCPKLQSVVTRRDINTLQPEAGLYEVPLPEGDGSAYIFVAGDRHISSVTAAWRRQDGVRLSAANFEMAMMLTRQLQHMIAHSLQMESARSQAFRDDLTGLYNSRYLDEFLEREIRRASRFGSKFCVFFIDLDNLKSVNDTHGHLSGSGLLKQCADLLKQELREVDSIVRYGGDEFVVILLGADSITGGVVAERLRSSIASTQLKLDSGFDINITCSIGVAAFPEHANTRTKLIKIADDCMYTGKRAGKNRVTVFTNEQHHSIEKI